MEENKNCAVVSTAFKGAFFHKHSQCSEAAAQLHSLVGNVFCLRHGDSKNNMVQTSKQNE